MTYTVNDLFLPSGYVDTSLYFDCQEPFVLSLGGRGIGKTYGCLMELLNRQEPFIYLRRTQIQIDNICIPALNPFNAVCSAAGVSITVEKIGKHAVGFYKEEEEKKLIGIGIALSTFAAIRGISAEEHRYILFDEIIPEKHERPIKEEGLAFANLLESINRNRELSGKEPIKTIMLSNTNTLNSEILKVLGVLPVLEKMERKKQQIKSINDDIAIFRYFDSPISARKKQTTLYRVLQNESFQSMSIDNAFDANNYEYVMYRPLVEYNAIASIAGLTLYKHKSKAEYYIITGEKAAIKYGSTDYEKRAFRLRYAYLLDALDKRRVFFSDATAKIKFETEVLKK